ncbi:MAG: apolipoprotein N-acyltransferase [Candidatus Rokubacteria bacterium]|nr:apolipoprotein N-acyltransferase [Candidatus Rokubacteria bacterium]
MAGSGRRETLARVAAAAAAGFALHLAYPRPGWDLLGWVSLAPVLVLAATARSPGSAFLEGWIGGAAFFVPLLRWLTHTMTTFSTLSWPLAVLVLLALAGYLALYWGAVAAALTWVGGRLGPGALWLAPACWVAAELARTFVLSGFPWGLLGYVPYRRLALIQIAAWTGVYGVSFLLVLVNTALAWGLLHRTRAATGLGVAVVVLSVGATLAVGARHTAEVTGRLPVGIVQGSIDQAIKWDRAYQRTTLDAYAALTRRAAAGSRLVVWPEAAVPAYVRYEPWVLDWLTRLSADAGVPLLVGAPDASREGRTTRYLNSAFLVRPQGLEARYDKMHLVPFGEYVPLKGLLFFVEAIAAEIGDFSPGRQRVIFPLEGAPFGTVICYEVIFPDLFRRFVQDGARFMVNITNDAWFGDSGGPLQHLAMVPLRAVENGVAVARAANTGVSALVSPSGAIGPELPLFHRGVLRVEVPLRGTPTFYTRFGDLFAFACAAVTAAALAARLLARGTS